MIFGCFCFYSSAISPKEDRIQKFQFMMLPFTLNLRSLTNSRGSRVAGRGSKVAVAGPMSRQGKMIWGLR